MELYFWLHRLSLHRRSCFGVKVLFEMTVKYGPPWLQFKSICNFIGKQKLIRQCHSADSAAFAAWLVWFLPPISCLSQAANPGRRFSRPGVTIAAWRLAAWIRTLTMPWEVENQAGSRSREMAKTKRSYFHVLVILLCVSWLMCMHCYIGFTVSERLYRLKCKPSIPNCRSFW